jgi:hypothetical protein
MNKNKKLIIISIGVIVLAGAIFFITKSIWTPTAKNNSLDANNKPANTATPAVAQNDFEKRTDLLKTLLAKKYNKTEDKISAAIAIEDYDFAKGIVTVFGDKMQTEKIGDQTISSPEIETTGVFLAVKTNGNWEIVWDGRGEYPCSLTEQYKFPPQIGGDCKK